MDKLSLIEIISFERKKIDFIIENILRINNNASISENRTIKDIIAHLSWYENRIIEIIKQGSANTQNNNNLNLDEQNNIIYEQNKDLDLELIVQNSHKTFETLLNVIRNLDNQILNNPNLIPGMPQDWLPWKGIYNNTIDHYFAHKHSLQKCLIGIT